MNNMLYIIVALVIIAIIAVVFLKKNKSQTPTQAKPIDNLRPSRSNVQSPTVVAAQPPETKFDDLTVAQRFIDQQRYDRAIETLERGLSHNPGDHKLRLKLLTIYALTKQTKEFYNTYQAIQDAADNTTLNEAQDIKDLFDAEQGQNVAPLQKTEAVEAQLDSLDFSLMTEKSKTSQTPPVTESSDTSTISPAFNEIANKPTTEDYQASAPSDNEFDLTLEDLEASDFDLDLNTSADQTAQAPVATQQDIEETGANANVFELEDTFKPQVDTLVFDDHDHSSKPDTASFTQTEPEPIFELDKAQEEDLEAADFDFDFDLNLDETSDDTDLITNETKLSADDQALQLDIDVENDFADASPTPVDIEDNASQVNSTTNNDLLDDTFSEGLSLQADQESELEPAQNSVTDNITDDDFAMFGLEDAAFNDAQTSKETAVAPVSAAQDDQLFFDDNSDLDALGIDTYDQPTFSESMTAAPEAETTESQPVTTATQLADQFAADFDFVSELDQNQVTLELAEQYLELGEYDSAKRLLQEVIAQGNSAQQNHAQALLAKTA